MHTSQSGKDMLDSEKARSIDGASPFLGVVAMLEIEVVGDRVSDMS